MPAMNAGGVTYAKWKCCSRAEQNEQNPLRFDLPGDVHVVGTPHRPRNPGQPRRLAPHTPCDALHLQPRGLPAHLPGTLPIRFWQGRAGLLAIVSGSGAIFVATIHFGSASVEPPADIINTSTLTGFSEVTTIEKATLRRGPTLYAHLARVSRTTQPEMRV